MSMPASRPAAPIPLRTSPPTPANDPNPPFPAAPARRVAERWPWIVQQILALAAVAGFCAMIIVLAGAAS
jgi:hypothetical protein